MARSRRSRRAGRPDLGWDHPTGENPPHYPRLDPGAGFERTGHICGARPCVDLVVRPLAAVDLFCPFLPPSHWSQRLLPFFSCTHLPDVSLLDPLILLGQPPDHCRQPSLSRSSLLTFLKEKSEKMLSAKVLLLRLLSPRSLYSFSVE